MFYKYCSFTPEYKYDIFRNSEIYFAKTSQFNDPFDSRPRIVGLGTLNERRELVDYFIEQNHKGLKYKQKKTLTKELLIRFADTNRVQKDLHELLDSYGIYCVSKKWNQCLMWSHYSDSHSGFCVGLEFDEEYDYEVGVAHEVRYSESYPEINPRLFGSDTPDITKELVVLAIATKSMDWSYESEVRFVKLAKEGGSGLHAISTSKIKEVIIGACASKENSDEIQNIVAKQMPWLELYKAKISNSKYEIDREKLP